MITKEDFKIAADAIGCEIAVLRAVHKIESKGAGFLPDGKIKILFEPHIFWKQLIYAGVDPRLHIKGNEDILYKKWQRGKYGPESVQHKRLLRAMAIHKQAALKSASWGSFQVMGFNYRACGYSSVEEMITDFAKGEFQQLFGAVKYIKTAGLDDELRRKDFPGFAEGYNGSEYKGSPYTTDDDYDLKLESAYKSFSN